MNEALKSLRCKKLLTQEDVSNSLNISRQTYSNWENKVDSLSLEQIFNLFKVFNASELEIKEFFDAIQQDNMSNK